MAILQREIDALRDALDGHAPSDAFLTTTAPASIEVGRRNEHYTIATDCGLGLRCHPQIAWAKLKALAEGAALVHT